MEPATGQPGVRYEGHTQDEVLAIARSARQAFADWRRTSFPEPARLMRQAGVVLRQRRDALAELMCAEMGKTLSDGRGAVDKCVTACDWFAEHAEHLLAPEPEEFGPSKAMVVYRPLGTVLAVMPWNFPSGRSSASPPQP